MNKENLKPQEPREAKSSAQAVGEIEFVRKLVKPDLSIVQEAPKFRSPTVHDRGVMEDLIKVGGIKEVAEETESIRKPIVPDAKAESEQE